MTDPASIVQPGSLLYWEGWRYAIVRMAKYDPESRTVEVDMFTSSGSREKVPFHSDGERLRQLVLVR